MSPNKIVVKYDYSHDCIFEYNSSIADHTMVNNILMQCHYHTNHKTSNAKMEFISVMKTIPQHKTSLVGRILVALCVYADEGTYHKDWVAAMLRGETGHIVDVNFLAPSGVTALHAAASNFEVELIESLLKHGANADIRAVPSCKDYDSYDGCGFDLSAFSLPLEEAPLPLEQALFWRHPYEGLFDPYNYTADSEETLVVFLNVLCNEDNRMKAIGLLFLNTKEIGQVVHRSVKDGEVFTLLALLLVAHQKLMSLTMLEGKECSAAEGGMKLSEYIMTEIETVTDEESRLIGKDDWHIMSQHLDRKRKKLTFALLTLEVFEKAGDAFDRYRQSKHGNGTSEDVAGLLKDAGCNLEESMKNIRAKREKFKEHKFQSTVPQRFLCSQTDGLYKTKQEPIIGMQYQQRKSFSTCVPRGCAAKASSSALQFGFEFPTAGKAQLMKTTKGTEHFKTGFVSNKQWFSFAFTFQRFIRRV